MSDENTATILQALTELKNDVTGLKSEVHDFKADQTKLEKDWNEKFFQLSRDTLNFARNVIVTAAVVAVLAPLLRESLTFALDLVKQTR